MASQEKRMFDKYLKFLTQKAVQVIVKSRQGDKTRTQSQPNTTEWFNIAVPDMKEVLTRLREHFEPAYPQDGRPVCVEISVDTPECESCLLERWMLSLDTSKRDVSVSVSHSLYPRLSLMLKSLIAVTRTTPAYQLSRKSSEDLHFSYQIQPITATTTEFLQDFTSVTFAQASCPFGTIGLTVQYRTKFVLQERRSVPQSSQQLLQASHSSSSPDGSSLRHILRPAFALGVPQLTLGTTERQQQQQPFAGILTTTHHHIETHSDTNSTPLSEDSGEVRAERQDSNDLHSITVTSDSRDGYLVLDLERVEPVFSSSSSYGGGGALLQLCCDPPSLDVFTAEGSMDINNAMVRDKNLIDTQTPLESC